MAGNPGGPLPPAGNKNFCHLVYIDLSGKLRHVENITKYEMREILCARSLVDRLWRFRFARNFDRKYFTKAIEHVLRVYIAYLTEHLTGWENSRKLYKLGFANSPSPLRV